MRAVIIAAGSGDSPIMLEGQTPDVLLPLVDRPFLQHVVEFLVNRGIRQFDFILHSVPEQVEALLGDGTRWGSTFRFHLAREPLRPYAALKPIVADASDAFLLCHADRLPVELSLESLARPDRKRPCLLCCRDNDGLNAPKAPRWTGWGYWPADTLAAMASIGSEADLTSLYFENRHADRIEVSDLLSIRDFGAYLDAQDSVLRSPIPLSLRTGREIRPGVWLSRNTRVSETARLIAPVFIGENCRIGAETILGPNVVIGHDCIVDTGCELCNTSVLPGSYVGRSLELRDAVVDRNRLTNTRIGASVSMTDAFILGSLTAPALRRGLASALHRVLGLLLLILLAPLFLATAAFLKLLHQTPLVTRTELAGPPPGHRPLFRMFTLGPSGPDSHLNPAADFLLRFVPGLINVVKGDLRLVGIRPRSPREWDRLPPDWRSVSRQAPLGLVTESHVNHGPLASADDQYASEVYYAHRAGLRYDLMLLIRYFWRVLTNAGNAWQHA